MLQFNWSWENNPGSAQGTMTLESSDRKWQIALDSFDQAFTLAQLIFLFSDDPIDQCS